VGVGAVIKFTLANERTHFLKIVGWFNQAINNQPILLMDGPTILHENLKKAQLTVADLHSKLREANVLNYRQVKAVVFETTGDVSVLHTN